jgi:hypothetical protein
MLEAGIAEYRLQPVAAASGNTIGLKNFCLLDQVTAVWSPLEKLLILTAPTWRRAPTSD